MRNPEARGYCWPWTDAAMDIINREFIPIGVVSTAKVIEWRPLDLREKLSTRTTFHRRIELVGFDSSEPVVFDGTWQQFVPRKLRGKNLPSTLAGHRDQVLEAAKKGGVKEKHNVVWQRGYTVRTIQ